MTRSIVDRVLPDLVRNITDEKSWQDGDPDELYTDALDVLVESLLRGESSTFGRLYVNSELGNLDPREVGLLYQSLRSFRLDFEKAHNPAIVPCSRSRRNQGLFYTPPEVVSFIVEQTLDAAPVKHPEGYLDLRILDPAVGTAVFLAEAFDVITKRALSPAALQEMSLKKRVSDIREALNERGRMLGVTLTLDDRCAVGVHLLEECLFGVDVDPVALKIAAAVLFQRIGLCGDLPDRFVKTNLRQGNALVGQLSGEPATMSREDEDLRHTCMGSVRHTATREQAARWCAENLIFHWPLEFREIFSRSRPGFDAVIGNPPYEIVSVKESGVEGRSDLQRYYRSAYVRCKGKINTYRLMLERGLALLRSGGVLGFIVPSTLLADSTADRLRREILDRSEIFSAVAIPEKAGVFEGVTQALLVLVTRKGNPTTELKPAFWEGIGPIPSRAGIEIPRELIEKTDLRIPLLWSQEEKALLESLTRHPPFRGNTDWPPAGKVHQGEINLTVHREFITGELTAHPLVRGEHVLPLRVAHPSSRPRRLDWVKAEFLNDDEDAHRSQAELFSNRSGGRDGRGRPWEQNRIVLGRVVNMGTHRRLKAAPVLAGTFLGDMTNYITDFAVPEDYLLGILNSSLLNWRMKMTSTNNYISAAEVEALPILRPPRIRDASSGKQWIKDHLHALRSGDDAAAQSSLEILAEWLGHRPYEEKQAVLASVIQGLVGSSMHFLAADKSIVTAFWAFLDGVVSRIYGVEGSAEGVLFP